MLSQVASKQVASKPVASKPAAKFVSAVFAGILAGAAIATMLHTRADAAEDCLSEPKGKTPEGMHWHYRIDHATQRQCWYMRGQGEASQEVSPASSSAPKINSQAPKIGSQKPDAATPRLLADAHAELQMPQRNTAPGAGVSIAPRTQTIWPDAASALNDPRATAQGSNRQPATVATRWLEPFSMSSTADAQAATSDPSPATSDQMADANDTPAIAPSPPTPVAPAAADVPPAKKLTIQMLALVIVGALALAGLIVSLIFRLGKARHRRRMNARRSTRWQSADGTRQTPWAAEVAHHSVRHPENSPRPDPADDPNEQIDRVTEFLELLSKQAQADADKLRSRNQASDFPAGEHSSRKPGTARIGPATAPRSRAV